jgi:hypothetical protein
MARFARVVDLGHLHHVTGIARAGDRQATLHGVVFDILGTRAVVAMRLAAGPELAAAPAFGQVSFGVSFGVAAFTRFANW